MAVASACEAALLAPPDEFAGTELYGTTRPIATLFESLPEVPVTVMV
jgi:hypothetical protein